MEMMGKKIPKYVFALAAIVLLLVLFIPLVLMPYLNQKPAMDAKHIEAQTTLRLYDMKRNSIENYRGQVNDLKIRWAPLCTLMFVDAKDTANDLNQMFLHQRVGRSAGSRSGAVLDGRLLVFYEYLP